jgi:hypothetical protein
MVAEVVREGAHSATFGFLSVLDGVRQSMTRHMSASDSPRSVPTVKETLLNEPALELHELLQAR